ncbi:hypothetical protein EDD37DRAFT_626709 [Exophiala viscosa]|uniref:Aspartate/glutamate racemase family protein n=1 Tax=Exophiala viscosa TaxID=2486360 RepID=A0AAN6DX62_9EURO|nr:hypothetical protein EDD36DRAFT_438543 [Exophiala viscosa]KAI1626217.1 hypothetical protein EDD37DRAFT_626709 [Exophiala viscosa]
MIAMSPETDTPLPPMGFIAVECHFTRPAGDAFNERTWPFPLIRERAPGSLVTDLVTREGYDAGFLDRFVQTGQKLAEQGAVGIMTSCGFLAMAQPELAKRLPIPVATSALLHIPSILAFLPADASIGVLTFDDTKLGPLHLSQLSIRDVDRVHIIGAPKGGSLQRLVCDDIEYSHEDIEKELVEAALEIAQRHPETRAILLECTQMAPFAVAIQQAVEWPVYDVYTMGCWFYSGLSRHRPQAWGPIGSDKTRG